MSSTRKPMTPWMRLQALSCEHSRVIGPQLSYSFAARRHVHTPPEVIQENCEILGRGDDEEIKARVHWYTTFHPAVFEACSKVWNS